MITEQTTTLKGAWHTTLKKVIGKAHPNFEISEVMKNQQASSEMKLEQLELGGRAPSQRKKKIRRTNRSQHCLSRDNTALAINS